MRHRPGWLCFENVLGGIGVLAALAMLVVVLVKVLDKDDCPNPRPVIVVVKSVPVTIMRCDE